MISKLRVSKNKKVQDLTMGTKNLLMDDQYYNIQNYDMEINKNNCTIELENKSLIDP